MTKDDVTLADLPFFLFRGHGRDTQFPYDKNNVPLLGESVPFSWKLKIFLSSLYVGMAETTLIIKISRRKEKTKYKNLCGQFLCFPIIFGRRCQEVGDGQN
jgi:hypothetical protein